MPPASSSDSLTSLVELVAELVREKDETRRLLAAFSRGEISSEQIVDDLAAHYQLGVASTVQALAEYDAGAAQQLGERLRGRLDSALAELASRDRPRPTRPAPDETGPATSIAAFRDRDDTVLLREYVLVSALVGRNDAVRSADLIRIAKRREERLSDEAVTAHLIRLHNAGIIGKERKGRYNGTLESRSHLEALTREIEARGLRLPQRAALEG